VPAAEERAHDEADLLLLAVDDELDVLDQPLGEACRGGELRARLDVLPDDLVLQRRTLSAPG
jgi:hypothetical protein